MSAEVTVIIPTYNNPQGAIDLVHDFYRLHNPELFRIISIDQTKEGISFPKETPVHLHVHTYRNLGFSKAMNTGWKLVQTPYTILANDDVRLLDPRWYEDLKKDLDHHDVLASNPFPATRTWNKYGTPIWYWEDTFDNGVRDDRFDFIKDKAFEDYTADDYDQIKRILGGGNGPGTAMFFTLLKTNARHWVGLLDEAYWNNGEDYDWNRRCFLTCAECHRRKQQHPTAGCSGFQPSKILTSRNSFIHHQAGATKEIAQTKGEGSTYDLLVKAKNIFNSKWNITIPGNQDIYGENGTLEPNSPWFTEISL